MNVCSALKNSLIIHAGWIYSARIWQVRDAGRDIRHYEPQLVCMLAKVANVSVYVLCALCEIG